MGTDTQRQVERLHRQAPGISIRALRAAVLRELAIQRQVGGDFDFAATLERARELEKQDDRTLLAPSTPGLTVRQRDLTKALAPWAQRVRDQLGLARPFPTEKATVDWIGRHGRRPPGTAEARADYRRAQEALSRACAAMGYAAPSPASPLRLWYRDGKALTFVSAYVGSPLVVLADEVASVSRETGYAESDLVMHVLAGQPLPKLRARAVIHVSSGRYTSPRTWATLHLLTPESITEPQVRWLVRGLRRELHLTKRRALQDRDNALLALVEQRPRRPDEKKGQRWERIRREWNAKSSATPPINSPWKMERAYMRVRTRLPGRHVQ